MVLEMGNNGNKSGNFRGSAKRMHPGSLLAGLDLRECQCCGMNFA